MACKYYLVRCFLNQASPTIRATDAAKYGRLPLLFGSPVHAAYKVTRARTQFHFTVFAICSNIFSKAMHTANSFPNIQVVLCSAGLHLLPQCDHSSAGCNSNLAFNTFLGRMQCFKMNFSQPWWMLDTLSDFVIFVVCHIIHCQTSPSPGVKPSPIGSHYCSSVERSRRGRN